MPGQLTAIELCDMVRDELQLLGPASFAVLRNGFPDDPPDDDGVPYTSTPILRYLNEAIRQALLLTGYAKCDEVVTLQPGINTYLLSQGSGKQVDCKINGTALKRTTLGRLDMLSPGWNNPATQVQGIPTQYYTIGDQICFNPSPDQQYQAIILTDTLTSSLVLQTDIPSRMPSMYMHMLVCHAAKRLNSMIDLENPLSPNRVKELETEWDYSIEELKKVVNNRGDDYTEQITVWDYRRHFDRGVVE